MRIRYLLALIAIGLVSSLSLAEHKKAQSAQDTPETPEPWSPIVRVKATNTTPMIPVASSFHIARGAVIVWDKASEAHAITKTYHVADLVVPIPPATPAGVVESLVQSPPKTLETELIRSIQQAVLPAEWKSNGGQACITYDATNYGLVVRAAHDVHTQLTAFLESLRKKLDTQVVLELRVMTLSDRLFTELDMANVFAVRDTPTRKAKVKYISEEQVKKFLERAQADPHTSILSAPKITVLDGQEASIQSQDSQVFMTGVTITHKNDQLIHEPKNEVVETGLMAQFRPHVTIDEAKVRVETRLTLRQLEQVPVPVTSVTSMLRPVDGIGPLVPFTQYIQQPKLISRHLNETADITFGRTAMMYLGQATCKNDVKAIPMLSKLPMLSALFTNARACETVDHVVVLVTPKLLKPEGDSEEAQMIPMKSDKLTDLLRAYHEACRAGHTDEARRLAIECLTLDPACFQK